MSREPFSNHALEELVKSVVVRQDAAGALLLILGKHDRAEVVAAFTEEVNDLPGAIRRIADHAEHGGGVPVGRHLQTEDFPR